MHTWVEAGALDPINTMKRIEKVLGTVEAYRILINRTRFRSKTFVSHLEY